MENIYLLMIVALAVLAIADLIVGVSNDAVNFLNSAIGSKAISFKTIMIVASVGIAIGAVFSSGMMEVARKGIFNPGEFMFNEIMIIFMAVMITDILLLDFFNSIGMPTSTTVSIVFELLGAAVAMALIKIGADSGNFSDIVIYINTSTATKIIFGILLSVVVAFSIGGIVQWISRLLLTYNFESKASWVSAVFGGLALTAITYFILMKGIKGTPYAKLSFDLIGGLTIKDFLETKITPIIAVSSLFWSLFSYGLIVFFKTNIYKLIILVGTFALALAFAGNDLVNFIGVPIAAWQSYEAWVVSGVPANEFSMEVLASKVPTPNALLLFAGMIMVLTLWFSSKAKRVVKTSIDLSKQGNTKERFNPNFLSRLLVRSATNTSALIDKVTPTSLNNFIEKQFEEKNIVTAKVNEEDKPAFDLVRASVNLMVAGILISIATSYKLPLSTTYVTFMVAMGTSLADRAWGSESAVYRVAGVLTVIGGWFFTAIVAFSAAAVIAFLINISELMIAVFLFGIVIMGVKNYLKGKDTVHQDEEDELSIGESSSLQGVIFESSKNISKVIKRGEKVYTNAIEGLSKQDLDLLKKNKKQTAKLSRDVDELRDNLFYFIKNLDESSLNASNFYINLLGYLQDITQSLEYINNKSYKHVNNNHSKLKLTQIRELVEVNSSISNLFNEVNELYKNKSFSKIQSIIKQKNDIYNLVQDKILAQVARTRNEENSPKNTTLYFSILQETKDLLNAVMNLLSDYNESHDSSIKPAKLDK
ncbi:MAG: inorganic phosphate transporter [Flavobacteriaceae bacterium]|mgnify:CR=1 FL=1|nr:inorganic phosphate transporter [Flavobacteriaceae bacterium]